MFFAEPELARAGDESWSLRVPQHFGEFLFEAVDNSSSYEPTESRKKCVYRGTYRRRVADRVQEIPARAVYYISDQSAQDYCRDYAGLLIGQKSGAGVEVLACGLNYPRPGTNDKVRKFPVVIQEDGGVSLHDVLLHREAIPGEINFELLLGSSWVVDGSVSALQQKILYDVFSQVQRLHERGYRHRDIRTPNVVVRGFGQSVIDVHASLIDFEFVNTPETVRVYNSACNGLLFRHGFNPEAFGLLEHDLAYLTILTAEVLSDTCVDENPREVGRIFEWLCGRDNAFFAHDSDDLSGAFTRRINKMHLDKWARELGLVSMRALYGSDAASLYNTAKEVVNHEGYADAKEQGMINMNPEVILEQSIENDLAIRIWENYNEHLRRDGKPIEYERYEDQPGDFIASNIAQAQDMRNKIESLGYRVVLAEDCPDDRRVQELSPKKIEHLAELEHDRWVAERVAAGWSYASEKDVVKKTSPYLVPWNELDEDIKEYDRAPVREMFGLIESVGLAIMRS